MDTPLDISDAEARAIVLRVSRDNGWVEPEIEARAHPFMLQSNSGLQRIVANSVEIIAQTIGSVRGRFIFELTQNVEDCSFDLDLGLSNSSPWLKFEVSPEKVVVESNQDGFNERDVRQISSTGESWKRQQHGFVGEKGIGFKAVFQVASRVDIQSNAFSFYFSYRRDGTVRERLGLLLPLPADDPILVPARPLTRMTLTRHNISYENMVAEFDKVHPTLLLFLTKIQKISIKVDRGPRGIITTTFRKEAPIEDIPANLTLLIRTVEEAAAVPSIEPEISRYYIFKTQLSDLSEDDARPGRTGCELVLAFQVDGEDHPITPTEHDVFAYLPVGKFGFNFLIQADFILQASREDTIFDSQWNNDILSEIANKFSDAVLDFCGRAGPLRYRWVEYLPSVPARQTHNFWRALHRKIIDRLRDQNILYLHGTSELRKPEDVRILTPDCLDVNGSPLFRDRPGRHGTYLSLEYGTENINALKEIFGIREIGDLAICHRIRHDLSCPDSKMKSNETPGSWHSLAAHLIESILVDSRDFDARRMVREHLPLIPLTDGRWVTAQGFDIYFPAEVGPAIPQDIVITIDPESITNGAREHLFELLGATECPHDEVITKIWRHYSRRNGAPSLASSKLHLSYLYWHLDTLSDPGFLNLGIYDDNGRIINPRGTEVPVYLPSEDEYGPLAVFRGQSPEPPVSFLNSAYLDMTFPINQDTRRYGLSWQTWLKQALNIRDVPRLKFSAGALSTEFRHILQHRPNKIVGILKTHWAIYRRELTNSIIDEIERAYVSCWGISPKRLKYTYFPTERLKNESARLGIVLRFPFLEINGFPGHADSSEDWAFLGRFRVLNAAGFSFYLEILHQHKIQVQRAWNLARVDVLNTYSSISEHYSERHKEIVVEEFDQQSLILDPSCFQPDSTGPRWIDINSCVWEGPQDILDRTPLHGVSEYRTNRSIARLFHDILEIQNADWNDYIRTLSKLRTEPNPLWNVASRAQSLYRLFAESLISDGDWDLIRNTFEDEQLIYIPSTNQWYPPSRCLWSSPVAIESMAVLEPEYSEGPTEFFLRWLRISPASLPTLVQALRSLGERQSPVGRIKEMIKVINRMGPIQRDLEPLERFRFLPIIKHNSHGNISLGSPQENFAIVDNTKFSAIFRGHVDLLDFSLEEVHELAPFLKSLGLHGKYFSQLHTIQTACGDEGTIDERLTQDFTDRAYELLRVAVSNRTTTAARTLYEQLLASSILKSDSISTTYTLRHANGDITGPITQRTGQVHIQYQGNGWKIFVPRHRSDREVCYRMHLPEALAKAIKIPTSCRELISLVLTSSISILDDLLENIGVGYAPGIVAVPRRRVVVDSDEWEDASEEEGAIVMTPEGTTTASVGEDSVVYQVRRASIAISEGGLARAPYLASPQLLPEPQPGHILSPSPQGPSVIVDAYTQLLGHVIRIAERTSLPQRDFQAAPSNGQPLPGYSGLAAFGARALDQMGHDSKIGAAGELFVYEILLRALEPRFSIENWRSTIRHLVTVHPNYRHMASWVGPETSDIVYRDANSQLTRHLIRLGYLDITWNDSEPEYLIEVKTTTGNCADRFFMSNNQYNLMQANTLRPGRTSNRVYLICRVYDLGKESMNMKIYIDPEEHRQRSSLLFTSSWTVRPGARAGNPIVNNT